MVNSILNEWEEGNASLDSFIKDVLPASGQSPCSSLGSWWVRQEVLCEGPVSSGEWL